MTKLANIDLDDIRTRSMTVAEYFDSVSGKDKEVMMSKYNQYQLKEEALRQLKDLAGSVVCVVFSAAWCKDCRNALPVLRHLEEKAGLEIRVFGNIKTAPLDPKHRWKVPPSPPETEEWNITHIPWIVLFDKDGNEIGTIIEKPEVKETLEEEILYHLSKDR
ncbi:MAG: TlpA family protein disulfide reductase [Candidatus Thorarchaeota archaeon]